MSEERAEGRGHLKIYLGMVAGVGKTYAMLSDGLVELKRGSRVVAGYIEPHGRVETETLANEIPRIPLRTVEYRGITLKEFDLDQALKEKPDIILVDELAHTNAPGCRHLKRYQDIEELLSAGISVWSTLNIQHVESLRDVIVNITGVEVQETVPDSILTQANQIEVVDIPPEDLMQRLAAGKIYRPDKVDTALRNFFQKGNLVALREIVLRHAADTVDVQLRSLRSSEGVKEVWATSPRVLVSVAAGRFARRLVHASIRLARNLKAPLVAVTVETPRTRAASEKDRRYRDLALETAERAGAEIVRTSGVDAVGEILKVAGQTNATIIVAGKPMRGRLREFFFGAVVDDLIRRSGNIDIMVVQGSEEEGMKIPLVARRSALDLHSSIETVLSVLAATALCFGISEVVTYPNLVMVYLLTVAWVASRFGRTESILASVLSVLAFDFCFVPPRWTFAIADMQYLVTFGVMLVVALLISSLALRLKSQSELATEREKRTTTLFHFSKQLGECRSIEEVAKATRDTLLQSLDTESAIFWPERNGALRALNVTSISIERDSNEMAVAKWVSDRKQPAGKGTDTLPASKGYYLPLDLPGELGPVWGIFAPFRELTLNDTTMIEGLSHLLSGALRRLMLETETTQAHFKVQQEQLRNMLLSSVSHDLRTPLTAIFGAATAQLDDPTLSERTRQLALTISESASRLTQMVRNVLDLFRFESGGLALNRDWQALEEIIGVALRRTEPLLAGKEIRVSIPKSFPLLFVDGLLLEKLFVNLFENIAKHAINAKLVEISAQSTDAEATIMICDDGPGFEAGLEKSLFEKLTRGKSSQGFGLGLSICKAIVESHQGTISASNRAKGGACFTIILPLSTSQPEMNDESAA